MTAACGRAVVVAGVLAALATDARADATGFALSFNPPVGWATGEAVAGTIGVGVSTRHAVRLNAASYAYRAGVTELLGSEASFSGRVTDLSIGWQYFPRALWNGMSLEVDVLRRGRDTLVLEDAAASRGDLATLSQTIAMRAQVAWTWRFEWLFVAAGVGLSAGYESGTETEISPVDPEDRMSRSVGRFDLAPEGFLRIGFVVEP